VSGHGVPGALIIDCRYDDAEGTAALDGLEGAEMYAGTESLGVSSAGMVTVVRVTTTPGPSLAAISRSAVLTPDPL
jgi:hypothetical protein